VPGIVIASRAEIIRELGARFQRFDLRGRKSAARERKRIEATMMIAELEQFCLCVFVDSSHLDLKVGLDLLSERLFEFLKAEKPLRNAGF